jgi:hypothetical protein
MQRVRLADIVIDVFAEFVRRRLRFNAFAVSTLFRGRRRRDSISVKSALISTGPFARAVQISNKRRGTGRIS